MADNAEHISISNRAYELGFCTTDINNVALVTSTTGAKGRR